jgi:hypothetical protein
MSLIDPSQADRLLYDIWRDILNSKGEYTGHSMMSQVGGYTPPPNPVDAAKKARDTFATLYPDTPAKPKAKAKRRR